MKSILVLLLILNLFQLNGQDGILDNEFGEQGIKRISLPEKSTRARCMQILNDGNILLGINSDISNFGASTDQSFYIYKLFNNGEIDSSFAQSGYIYYPNGANGLSSVYSMKIQNDGKFLVYCDIDGTRKLMRFNQNGILDLSVDVEGTFIYRQGNKIDLQSDGKIIIAGHYFDGDKTIYNFSRYISDGSIDITFGNNGNILTDITPLRFDLCVSIKTQKDDKIIAVGTSYDDINKAVIVRFDKNGILDNTFGLNGVIIEGFNSISGDGHFYSVDVLSDSKIVAGGIMLYPGGTGGFYGCKPAIARYNPEGSMDYTFGNQGSVILNTIYGANDDLYVLKIQPDSKVLVGGCASFPYPYMHSDFYVSRLYIDGSIDTTFANNGKFLSYFENGVTNVVHSLELTNDGIILAFGDSRDDSTLIWNAVLCQFLNNSLNINDVPVANRMNIFPNPTHGKLFIKNKNYIKKIELLTTTGKLCKSLEVENSTDQIIDMNDLDPAIYLLIVYFENYRLTEKIIRR
jgi:uncharacterized delta-60 repeat protein